METFLDRNLSKYFLEIFETFYNFVFYLTFATPHATLKQTTH